MEEAKSRWRNGRRRLTQLAAGLLLLVSLAAYRTKSVSDLGR